MNRQRIIQIVVAILVILLIWLLISLLKTKQITTSNIAPATINVDTTNLSENARAENAVDNQHVWQIAGNQIIGYRRDNGEKLFAMDLPDGFTDGTTLNSVDDTVLIRSNGDTALFAIVKPAEKKVVTLSNQAISATMVSGSQAVYWSHNSTNPTTDVLVREDINTKSLETLATFNRAYGARLWRVENNRLIIVPETATDLTNYDLLLFDLGSKQIVKTYQKLGYAFAITNSGNGVYATTQNFQKNETESYYLDTRTDSRTKLSQTIQAEPFASGSNDVVYVSAPSASGYDVLALKDGTVKKVSTTSLSYINSLIIESSNKLLVNTIDGPTTIDLP